MRNQIFDISFCKQTGTIESLVLNSDNDGMNWCKGDGKWGYIHCVNFDNIWGDYKSRQQDMELVRFCESDTMAVTVYENGVLQTTVERKFNEQGGLVERFIFKNLDYNDLFLSENNCSIEVPFDDRYTYADDCLIHNCNTHIWCGGQVSYINALKMGVSEYNLGLVLTKGAFDSYSSEGVKSNDRGVFLLNLTPVELVKDEEYVIEWVIFPHNGKEDFFSKALQISSFIDIRAKHYTVFADEPICFVARTKEKPQKVRIYERNGEIDYVISGNEVIVNYIPRRCGECRVFVEINNILTHADFAVKESFEILLKKRIDFIVKNQQYHKMGSPLNGAFLIYDNDKEHMIFDAGIPDHNACAERVGMGLLLAKYLQTHKNQKVYDALMKFIDFVKREFYDEESGYVYGSIGKDESRLRLYNAPWIGMLFVEMFYLTGDEQYLDNVIKLIRNYYEIGGAKFYPNAFSFLRIAKAFQEAGQTKRLEEIIVLFRVHAERLLANHISYPIHEVNYEQTIVSPAVTLLSEFAILSGEKQYSVGAKLHIEVLERFNGSQPSCHLNEIPIRYWDGFWFGKSMMYGDTFPHYWSCLTARSYNDYFKLSGEKNYLLAAEECMRNCLCLFAEDGKASSAYLYPYKLNRNYGEKYDGWANDQDFALYFALETGIIK